MESVPLGEVFGRARSRHLHSIYASILPARMEFQAPAGSTGLPPALRLLSVRIDAGCRAFHPTHVAVAATTAHAHQAAAPSLENLRPMASKRKHYQVASDHVTEPRVGSFQLVPFGFHLGSICNLLGALAAST